MNESYENYKRYDLIFRRMGDILRKEFIEKYGLNPFIRREDPETLIRSMNEFIEEHHENRDIQRAILFFPKLMDVPAPENIPEESGLSSMEKEILKDAYITQLRHKINELENNTVQEVPLEKPDTAISESIFKKFFEPPVSQKRYQLLTPEEISWIHKNVRLTEFQTWLFDRCCEDIPLAESANAAGVSRSKIKHCSQGVGKIIRAALDPWCQNGSEF